MKRENEWARIVKVLSDRNEDSEFYTNGKGGYFELQPKATYLLRYDSNGELISRIDVPNVIGIEKDIIISDNRIYVSCYTDQESYVQCIDYEGNVIARIEKEADYLVALPNGDLDIITREEHCIVTKDLCQKFSVPNMQFAAPAVYPNNMVFLKNEGVFVNYNVKEKTMQEITYEGKHICGYNVVSGKDGNCYFAWEYEEEKNNIVEIWEKTETTYKKICHIEHCNGYEEMIVFSDYLIINDFNGYFYVDLHNEMQQRRIAFNHGTWGVGQCVRSSKGNFFFLTDGKGVKCALEIFSPSFETLGSIKYKGEIENLLQIDENRILLTTYGRYSTQGEAYIYEIK